MARLIGENPDDQERTLLGGALSFEFSDCSIAAADLSKIAGEHITQAAKDSENRASKYVIGDGEVPQNLVYTSVDYYGRDFSLDGSRTRLVLAQRVNTNERTTERRVRKWLVPRHVSHTERTEELADIPFLAVTVGRSDTILPIASFARRSGGQCSYVQLGQEMFDDNFYVTTADDETVRHDLIEALREQVTSGSSYNLKENPQRTSTIQHFIDRQGETQQAALAQAYEQQLVRKSFDRLKQAGKGGSLTVIGEDHVRGPEQYEISTLIPSCILEDGRLVSLVLARPTTRDGQQLSDRLELFSVTREGVASPLASMSTQFMQVELSDGINLSPNERDKTIRDLLLLIIARKPIRDIDTPKKEKYESSSLEGEDRQIAQYLFDEGMLGEYEKYRSRNSYRDMTIEVEPHVKRQLESFFAYPDPKHSPFPNSSPLQLALSRLSHRQAQDRELLTRLQAGKSFAETLGEARRCDDVLMHYVGKLALSKDGLGAVFHNVQIGKTKAGAKVSASVVANDGVYELSIDGRPESMPDEPMKQLLSANLNPTLPLLGQAGLNGAFSETRVNELIDIVSRITSVNNQ